MSRTDLDAATIANCLRARAGDGSMEWVTEPIQASVLLDIADMLDENTRLKQELESVGTAAYLYGRTDLTKENASLRMLATHALRHIIEFECEADNGDQFQGKPCEWCDYHGTSDCPKIIAAMYGELGIEVDG